MLREGENEPLLSKRVLKVSYVKSTESLKEETKLKKSSKMSKKQWLVLLCLYAIYLLAGAAIFYYIETKEEFKRGVKEIEERKNLEILLKEHFQGNYSVRKTLFTSLTEYCGKPLDIDMSEEPIQYKWDFYHSLFFVITVVSTIGYGNLAPTTMFTRIFMIFYGLFGIPMNGIVIYTLGDFFAKSFTKLHQRWKNTKLEAKIDYDIAKLGLIGQVILYLIPGFTFFIFLPSTIMTVFEGWTYDVSVYYSFVSLTTIGFGDYVAGVTDTFGFGTLYTIYQFFLLVWIIGGMGYVVMILTFITNGMRSKKIKQIEHMLSENIKNTPRKIRGELRTLLHELLFMRVKPVYKGDFEYVPSAIERTQSCPDLTMYKEKSATMVRKRAMSECYRSVNFQRIQSDSDLDRIDKERTFMPTNDLFDQTELLFKVCNALSCESLNKQATEGGGVHGFSDKSILASEYFDPNPTQIKLKKRRAISDIRPPSRLLQESLNGNTWYGADANNAINEYRKRERAKSVFEFKKSEGDSFFKKIRNRLMSRDESNQDIEKQKLPENVKINKPESPPSLFIRRESLLSQPSQTHILEKTSIADFIRALSVVSTPENLQDLKSENTSPKARRHGIIMAHGRRPSLVPDFHADNMAAQRRFSLRPSDESTFKDVTKNKEARRKISVGFQDERRNSMLTETSTNIPPTLQEDIPFFSQTSNVWSKILTTTIPSEQSGVAPNYSSPSSVPQRRFSVRPVNPSSTLVSPVQKQLQKRERTDSTNSSSK